MSRHRSALWGLSAARAVAFLLSLGGAAGAATQYFDDAGGPLAWNTATTNWGDSAGGPYTNLWLDGSDAVFEGTAGTVTVATVTANSLTFAAGGYTLNSGTLTLGGPAVTADNGATIGSVLAGTAGLAKAGAGGTLVLTGTNNYTGGTTINAGTLQLGNGLVNGTLGAGLYTIAGGTTL